MIPSILKYGGLAITIPVILYTALIGALTTKWFQTHVVYLHAIQMTWFKNLNVPEVFGFLHNQVTPFIIQSGDSANLYAWHILPVGIYLQHERELLLEPRGPASDFENRLAFRLLRDDPGALLVIHFHGAAGTVGSGYRTPNYRALSAGQPDKVHVLTFDYRGFGRSPGIPTERGLIIDALAVVQWALKVAKIPPERVLLFGQSLGTAVNMAVAEHYIHQETPIVFAGHILIAPFADVATLVSTYSVAGTIPLLGPIAKFFPAVFDYLRAWIQDQWSTRDRIVEYVRQNEDHGRPYKLTLIHAEDDYDIPWTHTRTLARLAMNATMSKDSPGFDHQLEHSKTDLDSAGTVVDWRTESGVIREEILHYGLHDVIMGNPIVTLAVMRIFGTIEGRPESDH